MKNKPKSNQSKPKKIKIKPLDKAWYAIIYGKDYVKTLEKDLMKNRRTMSDELYLIGHYIFDALDGIYKHLEKLEKKK